MYKEELGSDAKFVICFRSYRYIGISMQSDNFLKLLLLKKNIGVMVQLIFWKQR
jgi:hypothetical protein